MANVVIAHGSDSQLLSVARNAGLTIVKEWPIAELGRLESAVIRSAEVLILDGRGYRDIPPDVPALRRKYPKLGILLIVSRGDADDASLVKAAMRAGVDDVHSESLTPAELVSVVDRLARELAPKAAGEIFGFIGAKGGVGTTTVAVNLATALSAVHKLPVALVDLHVTMYGDAALLLGVEPRFSVIDALEKSGRMEQLDENFLRGVVTHAEWGPDILASPEHPAPRTHEPERLKNLLARLADMYRWVILDVPHSDLALIEALPPITSMLLVINQELTAVRQGAQLAAMLRQKYGPNRLGLIVNRFDARADIRQDDIQKAVGLQVIALPPNDPRRAVEAVNQGRPIAADAHGPIGAVLRQLASRFSAQPKTPTDTSSQTVKLPSIK